MLPPSFPVSRTAPISRVSTPQAHAGLDPSHVELLRSADVLSRVAESRPGGYVQGAELVDMANNDHGQYHRDIQHAARVFLANNSGVYRAREAIRRRCENPRSACAAGRAYDFQDLQSMCHYLQQHPQDQRGDGGQQQHGGAHTCTAGTELGSGRQSSRSLLVQMAAAIRQLTDEMMNIRRNFMSLERLMSMGYHGHQGAGFLLAQPDMLSAIFNQAVHRNRAISAERLRQVGGAVDAQGNITSMGTGGPGIFEGPADISAGRWWEAGLAPSSVAPAAPAAHAAFDHFGSAGSAASQDAFAAAVSVPPLAQPTPVHPGFSPAADDQRKNDIRQQQTGRDLVLQQERLRVERDHRERDNVADIHQDVLRNANLQASQQHHDDVMLQQKSADNVAAQQRLAEDIRAEQILADSH